jgi:hypothetical protein
MNVGSSQEELTDAGIQSPLNTPPVGMVTPIPNEKYDRYSGATYATRALVLMDAQYARSAPKLVEVCAVVALNTRPFQVTIVPVV